MGSDADVCNVLNNIRNANPELAAEMDNFDPKEFDNLFRDIVDVRNRRDNEEPSEGTSPSLTVKTPASDSLSVPAFELTEDAGANSLQLRIFVPGMTSMQGVELDATERQVSIAFQGVALFRPLKVQ